MICKECKKKGLKSKVYPGVGSTTLAYYSPFYDEKGNYHDHDGNTTTTEYSCSNGHKWTEETTGSCWCGWPKKGKEMNKDHPYIPKEECVSLPLSWNEDSPSGMEIARLAQEGHSFDFLADPEEDIYNIEKQ